MRKTLLISASAIALIAGGNLALAQGMNREGPSSAPPSAAPSPAPGGGQQSAPGGQSAPAEKMSPDGAKKPDAGTTGQGSPSRSEQQDRSQGAQPSDRMKSGDPKGPESQPRAGEKSDMKSGDKPSTSGQGAAGTSANLTTEQRTKITTSIKQTNVRPVTNVNFNVAVGTVVPRSVTLHVLPPTIVEVYPAWRGYRFVLVGDEILIIEPSTYRIVAVLEA